MSKTLEQWTALYNKKIPEGFKRDERFVLFYLPEKGFCEIGDNGKMIIVNQMCGELKYWRAVAENFAKKLRRATDILSEIKSAGKKDVPLLREKILITLLGR